MYIVYKNDQTEVGKADNTIDATRLVKKEFDAINTESDDITKITVFDDEKMEVVLDLRVRHF